MARIYPKFETNFNGSYGEKQIFEALEKLPDDWIVFHSIKWSEKRKAGNVSWGEADFIVVNQRFGILVLEVKSGYISCRDGIFRQKRIDNGQEFEIFPFEQADRSKYKLLAELRKKNLAGRCFIDKAVWFPSIVDDFSDTNLPLEYKKELILNANDLDNPIEALEKVFYYYNANNYTELSGQDMNKIIDMLIPCFDLVPIPGAAKEEANFQVYQLTQEQKKVLDFVGNEDSVAICGAAGTGKTFVAVEQANRVGASGKKVLYLCFNRKLAEFLEGNRYEPNIEFCTIFQFLSKKGCLLGDYEIDLNSFSNYSFIEDGYDYLIIDEAQDLGDDILETIVEKAANEDIKMALFYDKNQLILQNAMPAIINNFDCKLSLKNNCRNTIRIMETANNSVGIAPNPSHLSVEGEIPTLHCFTSDRQIIDGVEKRIREYIRMGYKEKDITLLTMRTEAESVLKGVSTLAGFSVGDSADSKILSTTVKKFKGLEADCIIVVDYDPREQGDDDYAKLFYVAASRARQKLDVFSAIEHEDLLKIGKEGGGLFNPILNLSNRYKVRVKENE